MSIYTKKNAAVGYVTLKAASRALERRRRRRRRSGLKLALYVVLGLISFGILAGVAAVAMRRHGAASAEEPSEGFATTDEAESAELESESESVGEYFAAASEPIPAT